MSDRSPTRGLSRGLLGLLFLATVLVLARAAAVPGADAEERRPLDFQAVIETAKARVFPALVFVRPLQEDLSGGETRRVEAFGSGVIVSADGYVVTNHHVAEKAREIHCVLADRRRVAASVVGLDRPTDLALLKLALAAGETVPYAVLGSSAALEEGQFVMAMGAPYGFERSISLGVVSNARRHLGGPEEHPFNVWIQTDAAINPGNSGGPLVDVRGGVVGINALGVPEAHALGFAIPSDVVRRVADRLRTDGRVLRSATGVTLRPLVDYVQGTVFEGDHGCIVDDVAPSSPAEAAGLEKGDRLLRVAGRATDGKYREDLPEIRWTLADLQDGRPAPFEVERGGVVRTFHVTPVLDDPGEDAGLEAPRWNATFGAIHRERVPDLAFHAKEGVYVLGVRVPGNAARAGLREDDVVLSVDRKPVPDLARLRAAYEEALADARPERVALLEVLREGSRLFLALDFEREAKDR
jgi:S1-C subfamily serine protease